MVLANTFLQHGAEVLPERSVLVLFALVVAVDALVIFEAGLAIASAAHSFRDGGSTPSDARHRALTVLLVVGVAAIAAGWFYTGGPRPYGYMGLGEVFVFVFFGLVATAGTTYAAIESVTALSLVMGAAVGSLACALLVINNLRDIPTDREVGKQTLAVRLGDHRTRWFYVALIGAAFVLCAVAAIWRVPVVIALLALPLAVAPVRSVLGGATGPALIPVLGATGRLQLAWGLLVAVGLAL